MRRELALVLLAGLAACGGERSRTLTVSAAASLQDALGPVAQAYERQHPRVKVAFNFGGSGALARQIEEGAPVDVFLSAAPQPMDRLASHGLILNGTRRDLLRNEIVLIAPQGSTTPQTFDDLAGPQVKVIALGDPASVPAGDYGKQVLAALGLWQRVRPKLVLAKDVRQVLSYVETGNAEAGIVYATDARQSGKVRVAAAAPESSHAPVVYPVAVLKAARDPAAARSFAAFLSGPAARAIFAGQGFTAAAS
jgi:molybdate transport system substrate-binding protein